MERETGGKNLLKETDSAALCYSNRPSPLESVDWSLDLPKGN